ncbi:hypothetical protein [Bradyrhizobium prioriisuperbiae]|uniref:hypothetical protein n=1 Tax=Bradyrhizobium prioriisuperbiae TaxID=2854389 RepID=UPI0028EDA2E2|nr:hypothetical protein [Bradyrhizobium prioritasuperba]
MGSVRYSLMLALVAGLGLISAPARQQAASHDGGGWQTIAWPFPRDAWPAGRAYRCPATRCGSDVEVYIRPKIGFCSNCATGVADDDEVDRVTDLDLISTRFSPMAEGAAIQVADLKGRARNYQLTKADGSVRAAEGIALSQSCDLIVAVVVGDASSHTAQDAVRELLSEAVTTWVRDILEGRG